MIRITADDVRFLLAWEGLRLEKTANTVRSGSKLPVEVFADAVNDHIARQDLRDVTPAPHMAETSRPLTAGQAAGLLLGAALVWAVLIYGGALVVAWLAGEG